MSIRCAWIISLSREEFGKILVYRQFVTVEKRCKTLYGDDYFPLPSPTLFSSNLIVKLGLSNEAKQYVDWRDKANSHMQLPVVEVIVNKQTIWPVVTMVQSSFLLCCLPLVEDYKTVDRQNLLALPSVSVGFSVLLGILNFLVSSTTTNESRLTEVENYLTLSMPFGKPSDLYACTPYLHKHHSHKFLKKQPAWRPFEYKGKQQILFKINECVRSVQAPFKDTICHLETFGQISVKADLEGDVSLAVTSSNVGHALPLESIVVHPCVDIPGGPLAMSSGGVPKRFRFPPPLYEFVLLQYTSPVPDQPPIEGTFKMVGESVVELQIYLKLNEKVKNTFDYCILTLVFFHRGPVKSFEFNANHGTPKLTEDKYTLKWNLGAKFPRDLEAVLSAKVEFQEEPVLPNNDPFCVGNNSYVQLNFKQSGTTLSGVNVDPKNVTVTEGGKPKILVERSVQSTEYRIWNSYGDIPFPVKLENKYKKVFLE